MLQPSSLMWKPALLVAAGVSLFFGTPMQGAAQGEDAKVALFERYVEALRRSLHVPGVSGVVIRDGRTVWSNGLGFQDVESRVAASPDTLYDIASLTKTFTSTLLLQCVERGNAVARGTDVALHGGHS